MWLASVHKWPYVRMRHTPTAECRAEHPCICPHHLNPPPKERRRRCKKKRTSHFGGISEGNQQQSLRWDPTGSAPVAGGSGKRTRAIWGLICQEVCGRQCWINGPLPQGPDQGAVGAAAGAAERPSQRADDSAGRGAPLHPPAPFEFEKLN